MLGLQAEDRKLEFGDRECGEVVRLLRIALLHRRTGRFAAALQRMNDRAQRLTFGNQPPRLGGSQARPGCVEGAPGGLASLLDVGAFRFCPGEHQLRGFCVSPRGVRRLANRAGVALGKRGRNLKTGVGLDDGRQLLLGGRL